MVDPDDSAGLAGLWKRRSEAEAPEGRTSPHFLERESRESAFQDWIDAYWAKDIPELFRLKRRAGFQRLLELVFVRSGGIFESSSYVAPCEIRRATVANYLGVLEATMVAHVAIECTWSSGAFDPSGLRSFRLRYPKGEKRIVAQDLDRPFRLRESGLVLEFLGIDTPALRMD